MKKRICNPYLPLTEYVPDGEPRVFGDRLYVYGSHDRDHGDFFCLEDYVVWSAPVADLSDWVCHGVSYRKDSDPHNPDGKLVLFAPDVVQGPDGRFYLYYCLSLKSEFGVAVSDVPQGPFTFYGHICREDGSVFDERMPYDPSVLVDDDGRVYLYYGFTAPDFLANKYGVAPSPGCQVVELSRDMKTVLTAPVTCIPSKADAVGTEFENHGYFEAPSMRKLRGKYYLVYSSEVCHELCYAVSDHPAQGFVYGGVIVDNGDMGLNGQQWPVYILGNNHGGLAEANGQLYMFYHRHTQCGQYSRQGCAEPVYLLPDGSIPQVEITTSGLYGGPLPAQGVWSAGYVCELYCADRTKMLHYRQVTPKTIPYITQEQNEIKIVNLRDGDRFGFRYFRARKPVRVCIRVCGDACGMLTMFAGEVKDTAAVMPSREWQKLSFPAELEGDFALSFVYQGQGSYQVLEIEFIE